jgi:hypothetical protein
MPDGAAIGDAAERVSVSGRAGMPISVQISSRQ